MITGKTATFTRHDLALAVQSAMDQAMPPNHEMDVLGVVGARGAVRLLVTRSWFSSHPFYPIGRTTEGGAGFNMHRPWLTWLMGMSAGPPLQIPAVSILID